jgi:protein-L-isoaspartate(D-aspartate) O-methyltransferase
VGCCGHYVVMSRTGDAAVLRAELVAQLRERGELSDPRVAAVLGQVPRHVFVPGVELALAYADQSIVTRHRDGVPASAASQPGIVAAMLELLDPPAGGRVLEIGAGTGYNAALLAALVGPAGRVVTVEIDPEVADEARARLSEAGITNVEVICGDGAAGWPGAAPYDGIIVTAGASDLAPAWTAQLAPSGRLVVPLSILGVQQCVAFTRSGGHLRSDGVRECVFMPLTGAMANADLRLPVPGHPGVHIQAAAGTAVDVGVVAVALDNPGPGTGLGITALTLEVFGSLHRWLAFREPATALLTYTGLAEAARASGVPPVIEYPIGGRAVKRSSPCIVGSSGLAVLDLAAAPTAPGHAGLDAMLSLAVVGHGHAGQEVARLRGLATAWDAAGRPGVDLLRVAAYPVGLASPDTDGRIHQALHTTFVISPP